MQPAEFDEAAFFQSIHRSGARALLIGRRALVVLGLPVLTADYDFWIAIDDIVPFNDALKAFALHPTKSPDEARRTGRYALENDERVDVLVAREVSTQTGEVVAFDRLWAHRQQIDVAAGVSVALPSIEDLILTKRIALRPRDIEDIRLLETLKTRGQR
jgi:hypothetical protein